MRSVSATLAAAQTAAYRVPYFHCVFKRNITDAEVADYSCTGAPYDEDARIMAYRIHEFPYSSGDTSSPSYIDLNNYDHSIPDLRGCYVDFGKGDVTDSGNEYATLPRMLVKHQEEKSSPTGLEVRVILEGWSETLEEEHARLDNIINKPSLHYICDRTLTPYGIMAKLLHADIENATYFTLDALTVDDGIIDTFLPYFEINSELDRYESRLTVLYRLISMTACYLKPLAENHLEIVYPQEEDSIDLTIYSNQAPQFYEFYHRKNEVLPNRIEVYCNDTDEYYNDTYQEWVWPNVITGTADDEDAQDRYNIIVTKHYQAPTILNQTDADNRASAILARKLAEECSMYLVMPSDCRQELYDYHRVVNFR